MQKKLVSLLLVALLLVVIAGCSSQKPSPAVKKIEYPTKTITVLHGFKPGGGSDQLAQITQPHLEKVLGQKMVNVYKPGADGAIVWKEIGRTTPDGYTLGTLLTPKTQLNALTSSEAGYKMEDFVPIANMVFDPGIFIVPPDSKFNSLKEVLDYAKKNPGELRVANSGTGGNGWYNGMMIQGLTQTKWNNVPFEGDGPAIMAVAGKHVEASTTNVAQTTAMVKAGKLKALAVYTDKRLEELPDVPTLKELGINFSTGSYRGYLAPKGTPKEVVEVLANALEKVANSEEYKQACKTANISVHFMKGAEYEKWLKDENDNLKRIVEEQGLKH